MKKRGWIALLCGLLAVCPALAEQTDGVVRVGEVTYDVQTVQNALNAGYQLYESSGISLSAAQKQQLADSVMERFVGLGVKISFAGKGRRRSTSRPGRRWTSRRVRPTKRLGSRWPRRFGRERPTQPTSRSAPF